MTEKDPHAIKIQGRAKRIRDLEQNIFAATRVRVIISLPSEWEIFIDAEEQLSLVLRTDQTVSDWKAAIQQVFHARRGRPVQTIGQRGRNDHVELQRREIVIIKPDGGLAVGQFKIADMMFPA